MKRFLIAMILALGLMIQPVHSQVKSYHVVFIPKSSDLAFWKFMRKGCDKAVQEVGKVTLTWRGPAYDDDTDSQIRIVETYTRPDVDAIVIVPTDRERLLAPISKAAAAGIKIIVVDSDLSGNVHRNFIATDNFAGGQLAAKRWGAKTPKEEGHVVYYVFSRLFDEAKTKQGAALAKEQWDAIKPDLLKLMGLAPDQDPLKVLGVPAFWKEQAAK